MTIASDFFFDLTPKSSSTAYSYDIVESELLPAPKEVKSKRIDQSISQNRSTPVLVSTPQNRNFSNSENDDFANINLNTKFSRSIDRFKFTVIKKNNNPLSSPLSSRSSRKFNIIRVPKDSTYSYEENEIHDNDGVHIYLDQTISQDDDGIINLF